MQTHISISGRRDVRGALGDAIFLKIRSRLGAKCAIVYAGDSLRDCRGSPLGTAGPAIESSAKHTGEMWCGGCKRDRLRKPQEMLVSVGPSVSMETAFRGPRGIRVFASDTKAPELPGLTQSRSIGHWTRMP
ncbi:hypothetical protein VTI74DRAFT_4152 [Chaetomium olivicolor]